MPIITQLPFDSKVISLSVERDAKRSSGIHLSSIIRDRLVTAGIGRATKGKPFTPEEQHLLYERGFLWERMVLEYCQTEEWIRHQTEESASKHFAQGLSEICSDSSIVRPGECSLDSIYMTPDAIDMSNHWVEEWKATAMRAKGFDIQVRRPEWLWQACSYANVFGMTKAVYRIWHVADNVINSILVEWTREEVTENWARMLEHWLHMRDRNAKIP